VPERWCRSVGAAALWLPLGAVQSMELGGWLILRSAGRHLFLASRFVWQQSPRWLSARDRCIGQV